MYNLYRIVYIVYNLKQGNLHGKKERGIPMFRRVMLPASG